MKIHFKERIDKWGNALFVGRNRVSAHPPPAPPLEMGKKCHCLLICSLNFAKPTNKDIGNLPQTKADNMIANSSPTRPSPDILQNVHNWVFFQGKRLFNRGFTLVFFISGCYSISSVDHSFTYSISITGGCSQGLR